jgi:hypothetical protein
MQFSGHVLISNQKILVKERTNKTYVSLKLRNSGSDGHFLTDESLYLSQEPEQVERLKSGGVIKC